ncbi:CpaD family pilus assembly lipoprotein [Pseudomonas sp. FW300-N2F2]|uniref:CpaD family pilus assembly lipoprotein n=1 Tax=Pseudomonas sp. FW300-N2F2 TaxID=2751320 RepID=UPI001A923C7C|nr:CpaD family pilus assembly lipoprotein [Pseudomonas sp. FW300-N2F2]
MKRTSVRLVLLVGVPLLMLGCTRELNDLRTKRFANQTPEAFEVKPSALSVSLAADPQGGFTAQSLESLNSLLRSQGRPANQTLTLRPFTPRGEQLAQRLAQVLRDSGVPARQLLLTPVQLQGSADNGAWDLQVVSEAMVAKIPDCTIVNPAEWAVRPYTAIGNLGCANRANLARMVSDPRDLIRPRTLDAADGSTFANAVQRYQEDSIRELLDLDFSNE